MNQDDKIWRGRLGRYAPLLLWVGFLFFMSSGQGSMSSTSRFIRPFLLFFFPDMTEESLRTTQVAIRKIGHFTGYGLLALLAARAYGSSSMDWLREYWFLLALVTVLVVASIDEFNQSFNPARGGSVWDVLLDATGGLTVLAACWWFSRAYSPQ